MKLKLLCPVIAVVVFTLRPGAIAQDAPTTGDHAQANKADVAMMGDEPLANWLSKWRASTSAERDALHVETAQLNAAAVRLGLEMTKEDDPAARALGCRLAMNWYFAHVDESVVTSAGVPLLDDASLATRLAACELLVTTERRAPALDKLVQLARSTDMNVSDGALSCLSGYACVDPLVVELFIPIVLDANVARRRLAVQALATALSENAATRGPLRDALRDADEQVRFSAARALAYEGEVDDNVLRELISMTSSGDNYIRVESMRAIGALGVSHVDEVLPYLTSALEDRDAVVRSNGAFAIGNFGLEGIEFEQLVPLLIKLTSDPNSSVRGGASFALGHIGASADTVVPALANLVQDENTSVRTYAMMSLKEAGPDVVLALPQLVSALTDPDPGTRQAAATLLALGKDRAAPAIGSLTQRIRDPVAVVRTWALYALREIGPAAATSLPQITKALSEDPDPAVRVEAARALAALGPLAGAAAEALVLAAREPALDVRLWSLFAIGEIAVVNDAVLNVLHDSTSATMAGASTDEQARICAEANKALAKLGQAHVSRAIASTTSSQDPRPAAIAAPVTYDGTALVLSDVHGAAVIVFDGVFDRMVDGKQCRGVHFRWRYLAKGQSFAIEGKSEVIEANVSDCAESVSAGGRLGRIAAGPLCLVWSYRTDRLGVVYWSPDKTHLELADASDFAKLDLDRFIR